MRYIVEKEDGTFMIYDTPIRAGRIIYPNGQAKDISLPDNKETIKFIRENGETCIGVGYED